MATYNHRRMGRKGRERELFSEVETFGAIQNGVFVLEVTSRSAWVFENSQRAFSAAVFEYANVAIGADPESAKSSAIGFQSTEDSDSQVRVTR